MKLRSITTMRHILTTGTVTNMKNELFDTMRGYRTEFVLKPRKSKKIYNYPGVFVNQKEADVIPALRVALIKYATVSDVEFDWDNIEIEVRLKQK